MKILAGGDIHGNLYGATFFADRIRECKPDKVILLGDIYDGRGKADIEEIFEKTKVDIECVEGNCDYLTANFSKIPFVGCYTIEMLAKKRIFFTHGHIYNRFNTPSFLERGDVFIYGHSHINGIVEENGIIFANAGSIGRPRNDTLASFIVVGEDGIEIRDVEYGELIEKREF